MKEERKKEKKRNSNLYLEIDPVYTVLIDNSRTESCDKFSIRSSKPNVCINTFLT